MATLPDDPSPDRPMSAAPSAPVKPGGPLPPVEAPNAGFLLQLFLIPMIIVSIIVAVWLMISGLAHWNTDPHDLVSDLGKLNDASWQKAHTLTNLLRNPKHDAIKDDAELAAKVAEVLDSQLTLGAKDPQRVQLRVFLCRALGEFRIAESAATLARAATQEKSEFDVEVRLSAVEALSVLADSVSLAERSEVIEALLLASRERSAVGGDPLDARRDELRSAAAFALGMLGTAEAADRLSTMLLDAYPNVRFNAATGLARQGDVRCVKVLSEMLDLDNADAVASEKTDREREFKRANILRAGIDATRRLAEEREGPSLAELAPLLQALRTLEARAEDRALRMAARETLIVLGAEKTGRNG